MPEHDTVRLPQDAWLNAYCEARRYAYQDPIVGSVMETTQANTISDHRFSPWFSIWNNVRSLK